DRRDPGELRVAVAPPERADVHGLLEVDDETLGSGEIALVDDEDVRDLEESGLHRLDAVARARTEDDEDGVRRGDDVVLRLPGPDRLDEVRFVPRRVHDVARVDGRARETAVAAARGHRADVDARIERALLHADAVAEERASGEGARGIDGED